jgi:hypothetical protein
MAELEQKDALIAELRAKKAEASERANDLGRRLSELDRRRYGFDFDDCETLSLTDSRPARRGAARILGSTPADREAIVGVKRGESVLLKPKVSYGNYELDDIFSLGQRIYDGKLTLADIRNEPGEYPVPYSTMYRWCQPVDELGTPKWLHARDVQRITKKLRAGGTKGGGTVLGAAAEKKLIVDMAAAAAMHCPYTFEEVEDMVRAVLIEMGSSSRARAAGPRRRATRMARCSPRRRRRCGRGARRSCRRRCLLLSAAAMAAAAAMRLLRLPRLTPGRARAVPRCSRCRPSRRSTRTTFAGARAAGRSAARMTCHCEPCAYTASRSHSYTARYAFLTGHHRQLNPG